MEYNQLKARIENAPTTWIPGLLRAVVEAAIKRNVFAPGGMEKFIVRVVEAAK